jgi:hypothetical protein
MKKMQQAQPQFTTDAEGQELVHVALANSQLRATLYAEDYQRLMDEGFSPYWSLSNTGGRFEYVLANARSPMGTPRTITLARLIAQAAKGRRVTYADGDNLLIVKGGGGTKAHASALRPRKDATPQRAPTVPTETQQTPVVAMQLQAPCTPRAVDTVAIGPRARERMVRRAEQITVQA